MTTARKTSTPAAVEVAEDTVPVVYNGTTFHVPTSSDWPYDALVALEDGHIAAFLRTVLGEEQHEAFVALKPRVRDLEAFVTSLQEAQGIAGN